MIKEAKIIWQDPLYRSEYQMCPYCNSEELEEVAGITKFDGKFTFTKDIQIKCMICRKTLQKIEIIK